MLSEPPYENRGIVRNASTVELVGEPVVDFLFVIIELYYLLQSRRYKRKSVEVGVFLNGEGHFERKFQTEGASPTNHCWRQKTRVIAVSCGIKISAVRCLVLSQNTHVTDRKTVKSTIRV